LFVEKNHPIIDKMNREIIVFKVKLHKNIQSNLV
jgi:hypothetical protein